MSSRLIPLFFLLISSVSNGQIEDLSFGTPETFDIMTWNIEQFPKNGQTTVIRYYSKFRNGYYCNSRS